MLRPCLEGFVVGLEDSEAQPGRVKAQPLGRRQELPRVRDRFILEVIPERKVAQHLEEREMRQVADSLDVAGADALLARRQARVRRVRHASKERLELDHARPIEEERLVELAGDVVRHERSRREDVVALRSEEVEVLLAQFANGHGKPEGTRQGTQA